jgi:hypothetical protein
MSDFCVASCCEERIKCDRQHSLSIHEWVRFADYLATQKGDLKKHVRAVHEKLKEFQCVLCHLSCCSLNDKTSTNTFELAREIRAFFCQLCRKSFTEAAGFVVTKKRNNINFD